MGAVRIRLTSTTNITIDRQDGNGIIDLRVFTVEFDTGVDVQHGTVTLTSGTSIDQSITSIDTSKSFIIMSHKLSTAESDWNGSSLPSARFLSGVSLRFEVGESATQSLHIAYQVVQITELGSVQSGTTIITSSQTSNSATITSIDTAKSFMVCSYHFNNNGVKLFQNQGTVQGKFDSSTSISFSRGVAQGTIMIFWFVIQMNDGTKTQQVVSNFSDQQFDKNVGINSVATNRSCVFSPVKGFSAKNLSTDTDDNWGRGFTTFEFVNSTTVKCKRGSGFSKNGQSDFTLHAIEWSLLNILTVDGLVIEKEGSIIFKRNDGLVQSKIIPNATNDGLDIFPDENDNPNIKGTIREQTIALAPGLALESPNSSLLIKSQGILDLDGGDQLILRNKTGTIPMDLLSNGGLRIIPDLFNESGLNLLISREAAGKFKFLSSVSNETRFESTQKLSLQSATVLSISSGSSDIILFPGNSDFPINVVTDFLAKANSQGKVGINKVISRGVLVPIIDQNTGILFSPDGFLHLRQPIFFDLTKFQDDDKNDSETEQLNNSGQNGMDILVIDTDQRSAAGSISFRSTNEQRARIQVKRVTGDGGTISFQVSRTDNSNIPTDALIIQPIFSTSPFPATVCRITDFLQLGQVMPELQTGLQQNQFFLKGNLAAALPGRWSSGGTGNRIITSVDNLNHGLTIGDFVRMLSGANKTLETFMVTSISSSTVFVVNNDLSNAIINSIVFNDPQNLVLIEDGRAIKIFVITKKGSVGIGTENPKEFLSLQSTDEPLNFHIGGTQWIASSAYFDSSVNQWKYATDGTAFAVAFENDDQMRILAAVADTADSPITWNDGITIKPDGNIGIGQINPTAKLHVENGLVKLGPHGGVNEGGQINFLGEGSNPYFLIDNFAGDMRIATFTGGVEVERFRLKNDGKVVIGDVVLNDDVKDNNTFIWLGW